MKTLLESLNKEMDTILDSLESWKREQLNKKIQEVLIDVYKKGREDQKYSDFGPTKSPY